MDAMKFCHESLLICGSDSADSQPAVVQIWDVDALKELMTFPANDSVGSEMDLVSLFEFLPT